MRINYMQARDLNINHRIKIFLNGELVNKCLMADEEMGLVELVTENYEVINNDIASFFEYGRVRIVY